VNVGHHEDAFGWIILTLSSGKSKSLALLLRITRTSTSLNQRALFQNQWLGTALPKMNLSFWREPPSKAQFYIAKLMISVLSIREGGAFGFGAALGGSFATTKSETQKEGSREENTLINVTYNVSFSCILYPTGLSTVHILTSREVSSHRSWFE
jgi:hypothetical protein